MTFDDKVRAIVRRIPRGETLAYGEVARLAGSPGAARVVGGVLARSDATLPWWRVIARDGSVRLGERQARRLRKEGVVVSRGKVRRPAPPSKARAGR